MTPITATQTTATAAATAAPATTTADGPWQPALRGLRDLELGAEVCCADGRCGHLRGLVLEPATGRVTHLIVRTRHGGEERLAPVELVESTTGGVWLRCDAAAFALLEERESYAYDPSPPSWSESVAAQPLGSFAWVGAAGLPGLGGMQVQPGRSYVLVDHVPPGDVVVRQYEHVHNAQGLLGSATGVLVDPADHRVTHLLLAEGHLWHRSRVAIPMADVARVADEITLSLTAEQIDRLPRVQLCPSD